MKFTQFKLVLAIVLIAGVLSACGSKPADTDTDTDVPASNPTTAVASVTEASAAPTADATQPQPTAAQSEPTAAQTGTVSFANDVLPILQSRCVSCHGGDRISGGLSLKSYADLMNGSENGSVLMPGDAANSLLVDLVATKKMPKRGPALTPSQIQIITDWVNQGALNN